MSIRKILRYPHPILREPTKSFFELLSTEECPFPRLQDMEDTLIASDRGAALAANQIGWSCRAFVLNRFLLKKDDDPAMHDLPVIVLDPVITPIGEDLLSAEEGCLSFPGIWLSVLRPSRVNVTYRTFVDSQYIDVQRELAGFWARVFCHEVDHLDGKLFIDFFQKKEQEAIRKKMTAHLYR